MEFIVSGNYALFSDPITRVGGEKQSYQTPTFEAIRGICNSIYWKPTITWIVDEIRVMNQIKMESKGIRTKNYNGGSDLSYYTYLKNCSYQVKAHITINYNQTGMIEDRNIRKHIEIAERALEKGGRRDIFLGTRECQAYVEPCIFGDGKGYYDDTGKFDMGVMVHSYTYPDQAYSQETQGYLTQNYWHQVMDNGYIRFPEPKNCPYHRQIHKMESKIFENKSPKENS